MSNSSKQYAKNLLPGDWIMVEGNIAIVQNVTTHGNGHVTIDLDAGRMVDCLAYTSFVTR